MIVGSLALNEQVDKQQYGRICARPQQLDAESTQPNGLEVVTLRQ